METTAEWNNTLEKKLGKRRIKIEKTKDKNSSNFYVKLLQIATFCHKNFKAS